MLNCTVYSLIFDTSTTTLVAAVARDNNVLAHVDRPGERAQRLLDAVDQVLSDAMISRAQLDRVIVGSGPGGFTGLRVGIATARGIASALGIAIVPVPTLEAIGAPVACSKPGQRVCARIDARRGEWFEALVSAMDHGAYDVSCALRVVPADGQFGDIPADADVIACGPPTPQGLLQAAARCDARDVHVVLPDYGREPDAIPGAWTQEAPLS